MTEPTTSENPNSAPRRCGHSRRGIVPMIAVALIGLGAGVFATKAVSHGSHWGFQHHHGGGFMRVGAMMGPMDAAEAEERAGRMARHLAVEIDASGDQTDKLTAIAKSTAKDLLPLREKVREARKQGLDLIGAASLDRSAIEKLRADQMANMEAVSKRLAQALADAGEVMTPEQRKQLAERIQTMRDRHGWGSWRRG